jgi:hypothetical protein
VYWPWFHDVSVLMAWVAVTFELALAFGLIFRRTRKYVVFLGFALHIGILFYFAVTYFSMLMLMVLFTCMPPQWFHDFVSRIGDDGAQPVSG